VGLGGKSSKARPSRKTGRTKLGRTASSQVTGGRSSSTTTSAAGHADSRPRSARPRLSSDHRRLHHPTQPHSSVRPKLQGRRARSESSESTGGSSSSDDGGVDRRRVKQRGARSSASSRERRDLGKTASATRAATSPPPMVQRVASLSAAAEPGEVGAVVAHTLASRFGSEKSLQSWCDDHLTAVEDNVDGLLALSTEKGVDQARISAHLGAMQRVVRAKSRDSSVLATVRQPSDTDSALSKLVRCVWLCGCV